LPLPSTHYDTTRVLYRTVDVAGEIVYEHNFYSLPWGFVGRLVPVQIADDHLTVYDSANLEPVAHHRLLPKGTKGQHQVDPAHRPSRDVREREDMLRQRFTRLGDPALRFLEGLLRAHRDGKSQARKVLSFLSLYQTSDVLAAIERALRYHAFSARSVERILAVQARPRPPLECMNDQYRPSVTDLPVGPRSIAEYQQLLQEPDDHGASPEAGN
jgi:hypothetical protein